MNLLAASWKDWRDEDDTVSRGPFEDGSDYRYDPQDDDGAEKSWYEERDEEDEIPVKDRRVPANGPIKKLEELSYIRGFRDFPAVLTGGRLYDGVEEGGKSEKDDEGNPQLMGIMDNFKVSGGMKLELNDETREKDLTTILSPMYDPDDAREAQDCTDLVQAILTALKTMPEDDDDIDAHMVAVQGLQRSREARRRHRIQRKGPRGPQGVHPLAGRIRCELVRGLQEGREGWCIRRLGKVLDDDHR